MVFSILLFYLMSSNNNNNQNSLMPTQQQVSTQQQVPTQQQQVPTPLPTPLTQLVPPQQVELPIYFTPGSSEACLFFAERMFEVSKKYFDDIIGNSQGLKTPSFVIKYDLVLPNINEFAGIPVETHLCFIRTMRTVSASTMYVTTYDICFRMSSPCIFVRLEDEDDSFAYPLFPNYYLVDDSQVFTITMVGTAILSLSQLLSTLIWNKYLGHFYLPNHPHLMSLLTFDTLYSHKNICCVCHETCLLSTTCRHSLCVACWSNLRTDVCPICREHDIKVLYSDFHSYSTNTNYRPFL